MGSLGLTTCSICSIWVFFFKALSYMGRSQRCGLYLIFFSFRRWAFEKPKWTPIKRGMKLNLASSVWQGVNSFPSWVSLHFVSDLLILLEHPWDYVKKETKSQPVSSWSLVHAQLSGGELDAALYPACRALSFPLEGTLVPLTAIAPGKIALASPFGVPRSALAFKNVLCVLSFHSEGVLGM